MAIGDIRSTVTTEDTSAPDVGNVGTQTTTTKQLYMQADTLFSDGPSADMMAAFEKARIQLLDHLANQA